MDQNLETSVVPTSIVDTGQNNQLPGVIVLLKESWKRFLGCWKIVLGLEVISWIPYAIGIVLLIFFVFPEFINATLNSTVSPTEVSYPITFQGGVPKVSDQARVKTSIPLSVLPASTRAVMTVVWILFLVAAVFKMALSIGQIFTLGSGVVPTIGVAIKHGWRRWFPVLGHAVLLVLIFIPFIFMVLLPIIGVAFGAILFSLGGVTSVNLIKTIFMGGGFLWIALMLLYFYLIIRLGFVFPLAALGEGKGTFKESWRITKGRYWPIFWRFFAFSFITIIISLVLQAILGSYSLLLTGHGQMQAATNVFSVIGSIVSMILQFALALFGISYSVTLLRNIQRTHLDK